MLGKFCFSFCCSYAMVNWFSWTSLTFVINKRVNLFNSQTFLNLYHKVPTIANELKKQKQKMGI